MIRPLDPRLSRREALQFLHERHPRQVRRVGDDVEPPPEVLGFELFMLQNRICDTLARGSTRGVRKVFETVDQLLERGDADVVGDVDGHFFEPELILYPDPEHARALMPPRLALRYDRVWRKARRAYFG